VLDAVQRPGNVTGLYGYYQENPINEKQKDVSYKCMLFHANPLN
jgi:hypothetical protein